MPATPTKYTGKHAPDSTGPGQPVHSTYRVCSEHILRLLLFGRILSMASTLSHSCYSPGNLNARQCITPVLPLFPQALSQRGS